MLHPASPLDVSSAWSLDKAERLRSLAWDSVWCWKSASSQAALIFQWQVMSDIRIFTGIFTGVISAESWAGVRFVFWALSWTREQNTSKIMTQRVEVHQHSALPLNWLVKFQSPPTYHHLAPFGHPWLGNLKPPGSQGASSWNSRTGRADATGCCKRSRWMVSTSHLAWAGGAEVTEEWRLTWRKMMKRRQIWIGAVFGYKGRTKSRGLFLKGILNWGSRPLLEVARREKQATYWQHLKTLAVDKERCSQCFLAIFFLKEKRQAFLRF